jgi:hypothetical protein
MIGKKATIQAQTTKAAKVLFLSQRMIKGAIATIGVVCKITA